MSLKLVRSFAEKDYPFLYEFDPSTIKHLFDPENIPDYFDRQKIAAREKLARDVIIAGISDYHFLQDPQRVGVHLKTEDDMNDLTIVLSGKTDLIQMVVNKEPVSKTKLTATCRELKRSWNEAGLKGRFKIAAVPENFGFAVYTQDLQAFFAVKKHLGNSFVTL